MNFFHHGLRGAFLITGILSVVPLGFASFSDVSEDHPHAAAITWWEERSVIQGYEDGTFLPDHSVNRAEALKMILLAKGIEVPTPDSTAQSDYLDVESDDWFFPYLLHAESLGWIQGYDDGTFRPEQTVNLAEALKLVGLAWDVPATTPTADPFPDVSMSAWFAPYAEHAKTHFFVLAQSDGLLHGETALSRGELSELLYRFSYTSTLGLDFFPIGLNWPVMQHPTADVALKVPFEWTMVTADDGTLLIWHVDGSHSLLDWTRPTSLTALMSVRVEENEAGLSTSSYFDSIQTVMESQSFSNVEMTQSNTLAADDVQALLVTYDNDSFYFRDLYFELPEGRFVALHAQYGKGLLADQFETVISTLEQSVFYSPNDGSSTTSTSPIDVDSALEQVRAGLQVDGQGQALLDLFNDLELIETDTIGVGTGPVDYYYSASADVTLKYERSFDVILDLAEGRTTAF